MNLAKLLNPGTAASPTVAALAYAALVVMLGTSVVLSVNGLLDRRAALDSARDTVSKITARGPTTAGTVAGDGTSPTSYFIEGATITVAGAALLQHVVATVTRFGANVVSSQVDLQGSQAKDGFLAATVNCEMDQPALQQVIYELESGMPFLFIDQLDVQVAGGTLGTAAGRLRVQLSVSGQWKGAR
jgi:general secretion pathway protein M